MSTKLFKLIQLFLFFVFIIKIINCGCICGKGGDGLNDDNDGGVVGGEPSLSHLHGVEQPVDQHQEELGEGQENQEGDQEGHQGNQEEEEEDDNNQIPVPPHDFDFNGGNEAEEDDDMEFAFDMPPGINHPPGFDQEQEQQEQQTTGTTTPGLTPLEGSARGSTTSSTMEGSSIE